MKTTKLASSTTAEFSDIRYADCFTLIEDSTIATPLLRVPTTQKQVEIVKDDRFANVRCGRALDLRNGQIYCIPMETLVLPVTASTTWEYTK